MGNENEQHAVQVGSLAELNALVGRYVTGEKPQAHWEDSHAQLSFDTLQEALEALREPYFQQFIPEEDRAKTVLREIEEFRHYSEDLDLAWEVVAKLASPATVLRIWREGEMWHAAFGESVEVTAETAPIALCLAALQLRGMDVEFQIAAAATDGYAAIRPETVSGNMRGGMLAD